VSSSATLRPQGRLRINAPLSFGLLHLASRWPRFAQRHPDVELEVSLIDRVVDLVDEGFDLAIRISRAGSATHAARKLATSRNVVCASPAYLREHGAPATPADLARHACIVYAYVGSEWHLESDDGKAHAVRVRPVMQTNNGDTATAAALAGLGIVWQPAFLVGPDVRAGRLVPLLPGYRVPDIDILAVYPSRRHLSAKVRAIIDFLAEEFAGVPPWERD
jgi:DNA-binding transcriptional LysR family regulator